MDAERNVMSKQLKLRDAKNSYAAEASSDPEPKVDELCQEILVCSVIPLLSSISNTFILAHVSTLLSFVLSSICECCIESARRSARKECFIREAPT